MHRAIDHPGDRKAVIQLEEQIHKPAVGTDSLNLACRDYRISQCLKHTEAFIHRRDDLLQQLFVPH
ncbi:hypothetical protein D3C86_1904040 [compost metagenome]